MKNCVPKLPLGRFTIYYSMSSFVFISLVNLRSFRSLSKLISKKYLFCYQKSLLRNVSTFPNLLSDISKPSASTSRETSVLKLQKYLKCSDDDISKAIEECPELTDVKPETLQEILSVFQEQNISEETLIQYPTVFLSDETELKFKLNLLKPMVIDNASVSVVVLPVDKLNRIRSVWNEDQRAGHHDRRQYLKNLLDCTDIELGRILQKYSRLLTIDFTRLYHIQYLMKKYNVSPKYLKENIHVFFCNLGVIQRHLGHQKELGVKNIQPVPATYKNSVNYLAKNLQVTTDYIETIFFNKYPALISVSQTKLEEILNILLMHNFTPQQILKGANVFNSSAKTIEYRLQEMSKIGYRPKSLRFLYMSHNEFQFKFYKEVSKSYVAKINYLANRLNCDPDFIEKIIMKSYPSLTNVSLQKIQQILKMLLDHNFTPAQILKGIHVFSLSTETLKLRLNEMSEIGQNNPASLRGLYLNHEEYKLKSHNVVPNSYKLKVKQLAERFHCSPEFVETTIGKVHPSLVTVSLTKMNQIVDILLKNGFTSDMVLKGTRVFSVGMKTIESRLEEIKTYKYKPSTLGFLCLSARDYQKFKRNNLLSS